MNGLLGLILGVVTSITVPIAGAIGYAHGTFSTITKVDKLEKRISSGEKAILNSYKLICKMAIRQKLEDAEEICTEPQEKK